MSTTAIDNIGLLVTDDPEFGDGPLGLVRDAAVVIEGDRVAAVERAGADADEQIDAGGRCVIPGFVDSHTHLVFAGDRAEEFAARMAGAPYAAGGIRSTVAQTKSATVEQLRTLMLTRRRDALRAGITHVEVKSGYALDVDGEQRLCELACEITDDVTFLGAHVLPSEYDHKPDDYVSLVCGEMLDACAPHARWIDVFCERGAFNAEQSRAVLEAGRRAGLGLRVHANQLGLGPGRPCRGRGGRGVGRPLHPPVEARHRGARRLGHGRDAAAGDRLLDPPAVSRRPSPARRRGRRSRSPPTATPARATRPR